jgi:protein-S-isoprenylcysteine O-methyltransferase
MATSGAAAMLMPPPYGPDPMIRHAFWISYWAWIAMEIWIFSRDLRKAPGERKDRGSFWLIMVTIGGGITGAFFAAFTLPWARIELPVAPVFWFAIGLMWAGIVLRIWAVATLGRHFRIAVRILDDHKLITHGPYRFLRHPSYTGGLMTVFGMGLALFNWVSLALAFGGIFTGYAVRIRIEEAALRERFGEAFEEHKKRTFAVLPPVW